MNRFFLPQVAGTLLIAATLMLVSACGSSRKLSRAPLAEAGAEYLLQKMKTHEVKFEWYSAKFSADYKGDRNNASFNGQLRIRKDSVIWITLTPMLGIEAIRIMITPDSIKLINRLNDTYFLGNHDYINRLFNTDLDFDMIQSLLIGNDFHHYDQEKFRASADRQEYKLTTSERRKLKKFSKQTYGEAKVFIHHLWLDPDHFRITRAEMKEAGQENLKLESVYRKFIRIGSQMVPGEAEFAIRAGNSIHVKAEFSRISIDTPQQFPFRIPANFIPVQ